MILTVTVNPSIDETLLLDTFSEADINRITGHFREPGGKGINITRLLASVGEESIATGIVGGENGRLLCNMLDSQGVSHDFTACDSETRRNITMQISDGSRTIKVNESGETVSTDTEADFFERLDRLAFSADAVVVAGKFTPGFGKGTLISHLKNISSPVICDSVSLKLDDIFAISPALIKPNIDELSALIGENDISVRDLPRICDGLVSRGVGAVAVSMGSDGLFYTDGNAHLIAGAPPVSVRSTVGAGDCTVGGFSLGIAKNMGPHHTLELAAAFGSAMVTTEGTSIPSLSVIRAVKELIEIREI